MRAAVLITLALLIGLVSPAVWAGKIFMNGVDISQVRGKTFKDIESLYIDANGDLHIEASGYDVQVKDPTESSAASGGNPATLPTQKYFLGTQPAPNAQYDIVVKINGIERVVAKAGDSQLILEITRWLKKGENTVQLTATKNLAGGGRVSTSSTDKMSLFLGAGHEEESVVKIDSVKVSFSCNASQLADITKTYVIRAE